MTHRRMHSGVRRLAFAGLVVALTTTVFAQRGGLQRGGSYSGNVRYDGRFVFVRVSYPDYYPNRQGPHWSHDYPAGEYHFVRILSYITDVPTHVNESSIMSLDDPDLFKFPVIYMCEPGYWAMNDTQAKALRAHLLKGGFLILDDFRGGDWGYMEQQMAKAFPELRWIDLPPTHPIFHSFFEVNSFAEIPQYYDRGQPIFRGLFENNDPSKRLLVMANYNTDISEFWEWSDTGYKPVDENNQAFKIGVNEFLFGITH